MASAAAYSGPRWGELAALTIWQVDQAGRVITVDRKVIEVAGHLYVEAPKCRRYRKAIYPRRLPARGEARRPHRAGHCRAGNRHQPAWADVPLTDGQALAIQQLQPQRPGLTAPEPLVRSATGELMVTSGKTAVPAVSARPIMLVSARSPATRARIASAAM
jgi:hypothetical protein